MYTNITAASHNHFFSNHNVKKRSNWTCNWTAYFSGLFLNQGFEESQPQNHDLGSL